MRRLVTPVRAEVLDMAAVRGAEALRDEALERAAERLVARAAEQLLRGAVEQHDFWLRRR